MYIAKALALGLLSLRCAAGLPVNDSDQSITKRESAPVLEARVAVDWPAIPRIKINQISGALSAGSAAAPVDPATPAARAINPNTWFVKTIGDIGTEIAVYRDIAGQGMAPNVIALIEAADSTDVIGIALEYVQGNTATDADYQTARGLIQRLHNAGWSHGDPNQGNFINGPSGMVMIDFEHAVKGDQGLQAEDFTELEDNFGQLTDSDGS